MRYVVATALMSFMLGLVLRITVGGEPVGTTMLIVMVGMPLVGLIVTQDEGFPGGFSQLDSGQTAPWREWENWADLFARGGISGAGFAIDTGWSTTGAAVPWLVGLTGLVSSTLVHRRIKRRTLEHVA
jgi:hypothetical protein